MLASGMIPTLLTSSRVKIYQFIFLLSSFVVAPLGHTASHWYEKTFEVMGTEAKVEFEADSAKLARSLIQAVVAEMRRIDHLMSPFKTTSELSKLNREGAYGPVKVTPELFRLLELSIEYSELTQGSFDVTFSSLGYLYDFRKSQKPSQRQINDLAPSIDYQSIMLSSESKVVSFKNKNTRIDLGGIAKGHAVDQCIKLLMAAGIKNAFVSAGGDSRVIGKKEGRLWYIGIRDPRDAKKLIVNMPLEEVSISTSGDYERFFIKDGIRYHHILDPQTGDSARASRSVTILAPTSTQADALSTSVFVLGPQKGMKLINSIPNVSAIIIDKIGNMTFSDDLASAN